MGAVKEVWHEDLDLDWPSTVVDVLWKVWTGRTEGGRAPCRTNGRVEEEVVVGVVEESSGERISPC